MLIVRNTETRLSPKKLVWLYLLVFSCFLLTTVTAYKFRHSIKSALLSSQLLITQTYARVTTQPIKLNINVSFKNLTKIERDRLQAKQDEIRNSDDNTWVPAIVVVEGLENKAKIRLKGSHVDHWSGTDKWSLSVKLNGKSKFLDSQRLSLNVPESRVMIMEWLFAMSLKEVGLLSVNTDFVDVSVNGKNLGMYVVQEKPTDDFIKRHNRPLGPILKFNKDIWLLTRRTAYSYLSSVIEAQQNTENHRFVNRHRAYLAATRKLRQFRNGSLIASEVFDIEQLTKLMAMYAIFAGWEFDWKDLAFYYNEKSQRFELIGREIHHEFTKFREELWWMNQPRYVRGNLLLQQLFSDHRVATMYVNYLWEWSTGDFLKNIFKKYNDEISQNILLIHRDNPEYSLDPSEFEKNLRYIRRQIEANRIVDVNKLNVYEDAISISIRSEVSFPLRLTGIKAGDRWLTDMTNVDLSQRIVHGNNSARGYKFPLVGPAPKNDEILSLHMEWPGSGRDHIVFIDTISDQK